MGWYLEMSAEMPPLLPHCFWSECFIAVTESKGQALSVTGQAEDFNYLISIGVWVSCLSLNTSERQATKATDFFCQPARQTNNQGVLTPSPHNKLWGRMNRPLVLCLLASKVHNSYFTHPPAICLLIMTEETLVLGVPIRRARWVGSYFFFRKAKSGIDAVSGPPKCPTRVRCSQAVGWEFFVEELPPRTQKEETVRP